MGYGKFSLIFTALAITACTTYEGPPSTPIERSLTWFSFLAGDDIRAACRAGGPDHYRFVYNAIYPVQIRAYELTPLPGGARQTVRARGRSGLVNKFSFERPFGPWEMVQSEAQLDNETAAEIVEAFAQAVAVSPPSAGQLLHSNEYYWLVARCTGGTFALNAFVDPKVNINSLAFPRLLLAHDDSGIPFREAEFVEGFSDNVFSVRINRAGDNLSGRL